MKHFSGIEWLLLGLWLVVALLLMRGGLQARWVFLLSCLAGSPAFACEVVRSGLPELGGIPQIVSLGLFPVVVRWAILRRWYRPET
jgi:hypothetical protein